MARITIDYGIDLGTSNSTVAVMDGITQAIIPNKVGSNLTPSAVWIDKRGSIHVGEESKQHALIDDQDNADLEFKLRMGRGPEGRKVFQRSGREMLPEDLSTEVLKSLKQDVQTNRGEAIRAAVITVPAAFENSSTNATKKAAELAGLSLSPLLLEPIAASLAYGFQTESENVYWMVYDFGGGTFDSAIMRIRDGLVQVVNHDGDNFLGGKLIDWDIVNNKLIPFITSNFNMPAFKPGNPNWKTLSGKLKYHAEQAKIEVCRTKAPHEIYIENLCKDSDGREVDFAYTLTPDEVEQICNPYVERSLILCRKTLEGAGMQGSNMERILMVGGSTLNPWIRDAVKSEIGSKVDFSIDPVTVVARGAAIFASTLVLPADDSVPLPSGTWKIQIEHSPVGNVENPDVGGRILSPHGESLDGFTIELVDNRTQWRSGRITLGENGVFMTQLYAEKHQHHKYDIEFCDPTGTRIPTLPDQISYVLGVIPEDPPAAMTIGIGLADGSIAVYFEKGAKIPDKVLRKTIDHRTVVSLRAGHEEDELSIPLLEGEHPRAERNHGIGVMSIKGADIKRDLPSGSMIEITLLMDQSQQIRVQAYFNSLDEEFEARFDAQMHHDSPDELRKEEQRQKKRLDNARRVAAQNNSERSASAIEDIERQQLINHIDSLINVVEVDPDAAAQLDRRLRELAAAVDVIEDANELPAILAEAEECRQYTELIVNKYGEALDITRFNSMQERLQKAINAGSVDPIRRCIDELNLFRFEVLDRLTEFHVGRLYWLQERVQVMRDQGQAERIIAQGLRAVSNNDVEALKAANRQLMSLLPNDVQEEARRVNAGDTIV